MYFKHTSLKTYTIKHVLQSFMKSSGVVSALGVQTYQVIQIFVHPSTCCPLLSLSVIHILSLLTSSVVAFVSFLELLQSRILCDLASLQAASRSCVSPPFFGLHLYSFSKSPHWSISRVTESPRPHRHLQLCQPLESCWVASHPVSAARPPMPARVPNQPLGHFWTLPELEEAKGTGQ